MKDWTGNSQAVHVTNRRRKDAAENDYYATDPKAVELLLEKEKFSQKIWEPACGEGHMSKVLMEHGYDVVSTDLVDRGFGIGGVDFLECEQKFDGDIVTNPPYKYAKQFVANGAASGSRRWESRNVPETHVPGRAGPERIIPKPSAAVCLCKLGPVGVWKERTVYRGFGRCLLLGCLAKGTLWAAAS